MAFVILSGDAASDATIRTISATRMAFGVIALALLSLLAGFGMGYGLARPDALPSITTTADDPLASEPESRFLIGRVGELSGRLMKLESEAILLAKRIGFKRDDAAAPPKAAPAAKDGASAGGALRSPVRSAAGGPMVPAVGTAQGDGDASISAIGSSLHMLEQEIARLETTLSSIDEMAAQKSVQQMIFPSRMPVFGTVVGSGFGNRRDPFNKRLAFHSGLDFPAPQGSPIYASAGGVVTFAGFRGDYGRQVEIDHGNGLITRYSHARRVHVALGDVVTPGQHIGEIGSSGRSTGPHLHFEVLKDGRYVDPEDYLREG